MHAFRRFVDDQVAAHDGVAARFARACGLDRQLVWKIQNDDRDYLGQMPDPSTLEGLARGSGLPLEAVRTIASRSLSGYSDDSNPLPRDLGMESVDVLLNEFDALTREIKRRLRRAEEGIEKVDDLSGALGRDLREARRDNGLQQDG